MSPPNRYTKDISNFRILINRFNLLSIRRDTDTNTFLVLGQTLNIENQMYFK